MKFIGLDLVANSPDTAVQPCDLTRRVPEVVENAILFEELGFDGFADRRAPSRPLRVRRAVVLSHIVAMTSRTRRRPGLAMSPATCSDQETP